MCLLVLAWQTHPRYRLVVAANRDEYHERPAAPLAPWPPPGEILAGRDLRAGGTWLGLDRARRFGVVTNFRELQRPKPHAPSRGELIPRYLGAHGGGAGSAQQQDPGIDRCESLSQAVPAAAFRQGLVTADPGEVIDAGGQHEQFEW